MRKALHLDTWFEKNWKQWDIDLKQTSAEKYNTPIGVKPTFNRVSVIFRFSVLSPFFNKKDFDNLVFPWLLHDRYLMINYSKLLNLDWSHS